VTFALVLAELQYQAEALATVALKQPVEIVEAARAVMGGIG
jgi:hypothetical protein